MTASTEHLDLLANTTLFSGLSEETLEKIAAVAREIRSNPGDILMEEGSSAYGLHVIIEGTADVMVGANSVAELGPGDTFGEIALLDDGVRSATVTAKTPIRVMAIYGATFRETLKTEPELAHRLVLHLAALVRELDTQIADFRTGGSFQ